MNDSADIIFTSLATGAVVVKQGKEFQVYADNELVSTLRYKDAAVMAAIGFQPQNGVKPKES